MRTRYWVSPIAGLGLLATLSAATTPGRVILPSGGSVRYSTAAGKTRFEIDAKSGKRYVTSVARDQMVASAASPSKVELIGEAPGKWLILSDTYASVPLGMSYCQAGEERFLRVFTLAREGVRQTLQLKLASCRDNIELAEPGLEWNASSATLQIHWLQGPTNKGNAENKTVHIGASGKPD